MIKGQPFNPFPHINESNWLDYISNQCILCKAEWVQVSYFEEPFPSLDSYYQHVITINGRRIGLRCESGHDLLVDYTRDEGLFWVDLSTVIEVGSAFSSSAVDKNITTDVT